MIYIVISIIGLLVIVALFTYSSKSKTKTEEPPVVVPPADCCGTHAICEKGKRGSLSFPYLISGGKHQSVFLRW